MVAYEMAVQLQAQDVPIELLALLDCYPGVPDHFRVGDRTMLRSLIDPDRADAVPDQGSIAFATAMEIIRQDTGALASLTEAQVAAMLRTMAHNRRIVRAYEPGDFDGDVLFFLAAQARVEDAPTAEVWEPHISGKVDSHSVDATHIGMFDSEPAAQIGRILAAELGKRE
jgi:thioesterase domain-containing protein